MDTTITFSSSSLKYITPLPGAAANGAGFFFPGAGVKYF
jgi:hypothetical protein